MRKNMDVGALNERTGIVVDSAMCVHSELGPGLLESAYRDCLAFELRERGLDVKTEVLCPLIYKKIRLKTAYRIDLLVEDAIVVETKAITRLLPVYDAQILSHLKLSDRRVGLLLNFHVVHLKDGIRRFVNRL